MTYHGVKAIKRLKKLKYGGYVMQSLYPEKKNMTLNKNKLKIGMNLKTQKPFFIDMSEAWRGILIGKTGAGKTMTIRRTIDMATLNGYCVIYVDVKDEMKSSRNPCTNQGLLSLMDKTDIPQGMNMAVFRPAYFNKYMGTSTPDGNEDFAIPYSWLEYNELVTALGFYGETEKMRTYRDIIEGKYEQAKSLEHLMQLIQDDPELGKPTKRALCRPIENLIKYECFPDKPVGDFLGAIKDGKAVVFNMNHHDEINKAISQVYLMILRRLVLKYKEDGSISKNKRILWIIDEASEFLNVKSLIFENLRQAVRKDRYMGVYYIFGIQELEHTPNFILKQCRYLWFPANTNIEDVKKILEFNQNKLWHPGWQRDLGLKLQRMRRSIKSHGLRPWGIIDTFSNTPEMIPIGVYPSLSEHMTSDI